MSAAERLKQGIRRRSIYVLPAGNDDRIRSAQRPQPGVGYNLDAAIGQERFARTIRTYDYLIPIGPHASEVEDLDCDAKLERADSIIGEDGYESSRRVHGGAAAWHNIRDICHPCHWSRSAEGTMIRAILARRASVNPHEVDTPAGLREVYGPLPANSLATRIVFSRLHRYHRAFIALSPFLVIASADRDGVPEVSPRGDLPGFVAVLDDRTVVIPDRPGNKKLLTLTNVLENPNVSLIFLVPGRTESLRVRGRARLTRDPAVLVPLAAYGKPPQTGMIISVELAWLHCGRALIRSRLWEPDAQVASDILPTLGAMIAEQIGSIDARETEARLERANTILLWSEPTRGT